MDATRGRALLPEATASSGSRDFLLMDANSLVGIFVGYGSHDSNSLYRVWDTKKNQIKIVRNVTFDEELLGIPTHSEVILNDFAVAVLDICTMTDSANSAQPESSSTSAVDEQLQNEMELSQRNAEPAAVLPRRSGRVPKPTRKYLMLAQDSFSEGQASSYEEDLGE
jgi:hypothetical protein